MENMTPLAAHFQGAGGAIILALIAFSVVFLVLSALSLIIVANRIIAEKVESFKKSAPAAPQKAPSKGAAPQKAVAAPQAQAQCVASGEDENEIVAIIAAAIAATLGSGAAILDISPVISMRKHRRVGPLWRSYAKTSTMEGLE
jgi:Na+-transporting methylmalonyl-CoA/oxaloacetate decarboxylase gamma subunit